MIVLRLQAATGVVSVLLMAAGLVAIGVVGLDAKAPADVFAADIQESRRLLGASAFLIGLAGVLLLWFVGSLYSTLRRAEGEPGRLSALALASGALLSFTWVLWGGLVAGAIGLAVHYEHPTGAKTALALALELIDRPIALLLAAVLVGATSLLTLRAGRLPRWHGWVSGVLAALFVVGSGLGGVFGPPLGAPAILFPLWVLATSVILIGRVGSSDE